MKAFKNNFFLLSAISLCLMICFTVISSFRTNGDAEPEQGLIENFYYAGNPIPAQIIGLMIKQREATPTLIKSVNLTKLIDSDLVAGGIIKGNGFIKSPPDSNGIFNYRYLGEIKKMPNFHVLKCTFTTGGSAIYVSIAVIKSYTERLPHIDYNWIVNWDEFTFLENVIDINLGDRFSGEVNFAPESAKLTLKGKNHNGGIINQELNLVDCITKTVQK